MTPYELAKAEVGTYEWAKGSNPKVVAYYRDAGHPEVKDDAVAWCAAFVGAMINRAGGKPSGSLAARSYLEWGEKVADLGKAQPGDVVVFKRGNSSWQGHVGFYVGHDASSVSVLGGNQKDAVSVSKQSRASLVGIRRAKAPEIRTAEALAPETTQPPAKSLLATLAGLFRALFRKGA